MTIYTAKYGWAGEEKDYRLLDIPTVIARDPKGNYLVTATTDKIHHYVTRIYCVVANPTMENIQNASWFFDTGLGPDWANYMAWQLLQFIDKAEAKDKEDVIELPRKVVGIAAMYMHEYVNRTEFVDTDDEQEFYSTLNTINEALREQQ